MKLKRLPKGFSLPQHYTSIPTANHTPEECPVLQLVIQLSTSRPPPPPLRLSSKLWFAKLQSSFQPVSPKYVVLDELKKSLEDFSRNK